MKFLCPQEELARALSIVGHAIAANNTLPVLDNILIRAEQDHVTFIATDLELAIEFVLTIPVDMPGSITVPAKLLSSYVNLLPPTSDITVEVAEGDTLELRSKGSNTKIKGLPAKDYPALPEFKGEAAFQVPTGELVKATQRVLFSASQNASRPILSGVYIAAQESQMKVVATDSYRLSESTIGLEKPVEGEGVVRIVPAKTMQDVVRIFAKEMNDLSVEVSQNQVLFSAGNTRITSRLIEGRFPDYQAIIPKKHESTATLNVQELLLATKRVNLFAKENNFNIRVEVLAEKEAVMLTTDSTQIGEEETTVTARVEGADGKIALNARYLIDVLTNIGGDEIILEIDTPLSPAVIKAKGDTQYIHIIMPLKLN